MRYFLLEGNDYEFLFTQIIFESGSSFWPLAVNCTSVLIFDDDIAEPVEDIQLSITSSDPRVNVGNTLFSIEIIDDDMPGTYYFGLYSIINSIPNVALYKISIKNYTCYF